MSIDILFGAPDPVIDEMIKSLKTYEEAHPSSQITLYRQNCVSVRVRIIDPGFRGLDEKERSKNLWQYVEKLPDEVQSDLTSLILLTPDETSMSLANMDFEHPISSIL